MRPPQEGSDLLLKPRAAFLARRRLDRLLPGQQDPWLLTSSEDDPVAYFNVIPGEGSGQFGVSADISGRHYREDAAVIFIPRQLQLVVGGNLTNDFDEFVTQA